MGRRSTGLVAAAGLGLAVVVGGCAAISDLIDLEERIEDAGYDVTGTFHDDFGGGRNEVEIEAESRIRGEPPPAGQLEIAEIVWDTYPRQFDTLEIDLDGDTDTFSRGELQEQFGPRDPELDERDFDDEVRSGLRTASITAAAFLVAGIIAIVVTLVVLRRRTNRNPPPPPPPPAPPPGWVPRQAPPPPPPVAPPPPPPPLG